MKIGFYTKWNLDKGRFIGDQLYADYMCKNLLRFENVDSAKLYAPNKLPKEKLDFMIYLNDTPLIKNWAKKHIYYFQNAYNEKGSVKKLREISKYKFDLYLFVSEKLRKQFVLKEKYTTTEWIGIECDELRGVDRLCLIKNNFNSQTS